MFYKTTCLIFFLWLTIYSAFGSGSSHDILLRLPLISDKNVELIASALDNIDGILEISACYELKVLIVVYDETKITDENILVNTINSNAANTSVEKINSSDISIIKQNYKLKEIRRNDKSAH